LTFIPVFILLTVGKVRTPPPGNLRPVVLTFQQANAHAGRGTT
jgi:hypothetical protein